MAGKNLSMRGMRGMSTVMIAVLRRGRADVLGGDWLSHRYKLLETHA